MKLKTLMPYSFVVMKCLNHVLVLISEICPWSFPPHNDYAFIRLYVYLNLKKKMSTSDSFIMQKYNLTLFFFFCMHRFMTAGYTSLFSNSFCFAGSPPVRFFLPFTWILNSHLLHKIDMTHKNLWRSTDIEISMCGLDRNLGSQHSSTWMLCFNLNQNAKSPWRNWKYFKVDSWFSLKLHGEVTH